MEQNFSTVCFSPHSENISKRGMIMAYVFFKAETWISQFATQRGEMVLFEMQKTALVQAPSATPGLSGWTRARHAEPHPCIPMRFLLIQTTAQNLTAEETVLLPFRVKTWVNTHSDTNFYCLGTRLLVLTVFYLSSTRT